MEPYPIASVDVPPDADLAAIATLAGAPEPARRYYVEPRLFVVGVTQADLEAALADGGVAQPSPRYVPVATVRERMEAVGLWEALVALLPMSQLAKVLSLRDGLDANDPQVRAALAAVGADPDVILAP